MGLIFVDSCLVIYAFEDHPLHGEAVRQAFAHENPEDLAIAPCGRPMSVCGVPPDLSP